VAMKISGHKIRSTFDRDNVVSKDDIHEAVHRTADYVSKLSTEREVVPLVVSDKPNRDVTWTIRRSSPSCVLMHNDWLAEAGGNRTHRCRGQPAAGRL